MIPAIIAGLAAIAVLWLGDIPQHLGAHPQWAQSVIWIGGGIGLVSGLLAGLARLWIAAALGFIGIVAAYITANTGKTRFAASYAEDAFAGQMWFFGWIATCAAVVATVLILTKLLRDRP